MWAGGHGGKLAILLQIKWGGGPQPLSAPADCGHLRVGGQGAKASELFP